MNPVPVSFLEIEELAQSVDEQYSMIISDADFVVHQMALYLMAEKASDETYYELFPVWILSMEQIQDKQGRKSGHLCKVLFMQRPERLFHR